MPMPLELLQARFAAAVLDPAHCDALLGSLAHARGAALRVRIGLYRADLAAACERALAGAFPVVRALVGGEFFALLAREYAQHNPSVSGDMNRFGAQLAQFIGGFAPARALPYLADVAALDWAVHAAHYAADATRLARERITGLAAGDLLAATFAVNPACSWLTSRWAIASLWRAHQAERAVELPADVARAEGALVVRPLYGVDVLACGAGEMAALAELRLGHDMEAAIAAGLQAEPAFDFPKALVRWLDAAVLVEAPVD